LYPRLKKEDAFPKRATKMKKALQLCKLDEGLFEK
jgi:hypothetical protein